MVLRRGGAPVWARSGQRTRADGRAGEVPGKRDGDVEAGNDSAEGGVDVGTARGDTTCIENGEVDRVEATQCAELQFLRQQVGVVPLNFRGYLDLVEDAAPGSCRCRLLERNPLAPVVVVQRKTAGSGMTARRGANLTVPLESDARASEGGRRLNILAERFERRQDLERLRRLQVKALLDLGWEVGVGVRKRGWRPLTGSVPVRAVFSSVRGTLRMLARIAARSARVRQAIVVITVVMVRIMTMSVMMIGFPHTIEGEEPIVTVELRTNERPKSVGRQEGDEEDSNAFQRACTGTSATTVTSALLTDAKLEKLFIDCALCRHVHTLVEVRVVRHGVEWFLSKVHNAKLREMGVTQGSSLCIGLSRRLEYKYFLTGGVGRRLSSRTKVAGSLRHNFACPPRVRTNTNYKCCTPSTDRHSFTEHEQCCDSASFA